VRAGASHELWPGYYLGCDYQLLLIEESSANKVYLHFSNGNGSLGMIYENGYSGDQIGVMFDYAYEIIQDLIASVYVDYTNIARKRFTNTIISQVTPPGSLTASAKN